MAPRCNNQYVPQDSAGVQTQEGVRKRKSGRDVPGKQPTADEPLFCPKLKSEEGGSEGLDPSQNVAGKSLILGSPVVLCVGLLSEAADPWLCTRWVPGCFRKVRILVHAGKSFQTEAYIL